MEKSIDVARIKAYNQELRQLADKSAQARAELELSKRELQKLCQELTEELGVQVTAQNLQAVYEQCVEKIENTLKTGEEIIARIKSEGQPMGAAQTAGMSANMGANMGAQQPTYAQPIQAGAMPQGIGVNAQTGAPIQPDIPHPMGDSWQMNTPTQQTLQGTQGTQGMGVGAQGVQGMVGAQNQQMEAQAQSIPSFLQSAANRPKPSGNQEKIVLDI